MNSNTGQFSIMTSAAPHLNGHQVVFGRVLHGLEFLLALEKVEVDANSRPLEPVVIVNCGLLPEVEAHSLVADAVAAANPKA